MIYTLRIDEKENNFSHKNESGKPWSLHVLVILGDCYTKKMQWAYSQVKELFKTGTRRQMYQTNHSMSYEKFKTRGILLPIYNATVASQKL